MKVISLTRGKWAFVDDADFHLVSGHKWYAVKAKHTFYASSSKGLSMHRVITGVTDSTVMVDHRNQNGLDNRRFNLRPTDQATNYFNSQYIGRHRKYQRRAPINRDKSAVRMFTVLLHPENREHLKTLRKLWGLKSDAAALNKFLTRHRNLSRESGTTNRRPPIDIQSRVP